MRQSSKIRAGRAARSAALHALLSLLALLIGAGRGLGDELVVAAAASLREPAQALASEFEAQHGTRVLLTLGASSALAAQIRLGAPIDVFLSADERLIDRLEAQRLVDPARRFAFASNRLVVLQSPGGRFSIEQAGDLLQPAIRRVALPAAAVPVGRYAREWLEGHRLLEPLADRLVVTEHARASLAAVEQGHADVAIVYATDARVAKHSTIAYVIPASEQPAIVYSAAAIERPGDPVQARAFLSGLRGEAAAALLRAAGFDPPHARGRAQPR